jgi:hypothetical protein
MNFNNCTSIFQFVSQCENFTADVYDQVLYISFVSFVAVRFIGYSQSNLYSYVLFNDSVSNVDR